MENRLPTASRPLCPPVGLHVFNRVCRRCKRRTFVWLNGGLLPLLALAFAAQLFVIASAASAAPAYNKRGIDPVPQAWTTSLKTAVANPSAELQVAKIATIVLPNLGTTQFFTGGTENLASGNTRWQGTVAVGGQMVPAELILTKDGAIGDVRTANGRIRLDVAASGIQTAQLFAPAATTGDVCATPSSPALAAKTSAASTQDNSKRVNDVIAASLNSMDTATVDVMFVYTPRVAAQYGSQLPAVLDNLIATTNAATRNSDARVQLRQVGALKITPRIVSGDLSATLKAVAASEDVATIAPDGYADVAAKRKLFGADIVVYLVAFGDYSVGCPVGSGCVVGAAFQTSHHSLINDDPGQRGYAIVDIAARDLPLTVAHEIGHVLGAGHDAETGGAGLFADSNGYRWKQGAVGDVMSYAATRTLMFSNPAIMCGNEPCGVGADQSGAADNTRALKAARFLVADFRKSQVVLSDMTGLWSEQNAGVQDTASALHLSQRGRVLTAVWYQYDSRGNPVWLSVPNCLVEGDRCRGALYQSYAIVSAGGTPLAPTMVMPSEIGSVELILGDRHAVQMNASVYGVDRRTSFARALPAREPVADDQTVDGVWWFSMDLGPGLTITRHAGSLSLQWFGFDADGRRNWYSAPDCQLTGTSKACSGALYRSSAVGAQSTASLVGSIGIQFSSAYAGRVDMQIAGRTYTAAIERELALD